MYNIFVNRNTIFTIDDNRVVSDEGIKYELLERLGAGGNGVVYECIDMNGNQYAIKFLFKLDEKHRNRFNQEIKLMNMVNHPHIIGFFGSGKVNARDINGNDCFLYFIVLDIAEENLANFIKKNSVDYPFYSAQFRGLCEALEEIHKYAIHRDIKPENILIKGDKWLISDFGLCEFISETEHNTLTRTNEKVGPALWISPEAVNDVYFGGDSIRTYSDVYQLGLVFLFIASKSYPGGVITENFCDMPKELLKLLLKTVANNPEIRPQNGASLLNEYNKATLFRTD